IIECRHNAAAEMVVPDTIDDHAWRQRVFSGGQPFGQRSSPSGSLTIRWRNLRRRIAVCRYGQEARLHQRSMAVRIASDEEVGWRNLIASRPSMQVRSF